MEISVKSSEPPLKVGYAYQNLLEVPFKSTFSSFQLQMA